MKNIAIGLVIGIIASLIFKQCGPGSNNNDIIKSDTVIVKTVEYDTIYKIDTVVEYKDVIVKIPVETEAPIHEPGVVDDSLRTYVDTVHYDNLSVSYDLAVSGQMESLRLGYIDTRPEIIKRITETKTITNTVSPKGVYIGVGLGSNFKDFHSPSIQLSYLKRKQILSIGYDPFNTYGSITYSFKLF